MVLHTILDRLLLITLLPGHPFGIMELLVSVMRRRPGKHCALWETTMIVGAPMSLMMVEQSTHLQKSTRRFTRMADILIAVGKPGL